MKVALESYKALYRCHPPLKGVMSFFFFFYENPGGNISIFTFLSDYAFSISYTRLSYCHLCIICPVSFLIQLSA